MYKYFIKVFLGATETLILDTPSTICHLPCWLLERSLATNPNRTFYFHFMSNVFHVISTSKLLKFSKKTFATATLTITQLPFHHVNSSQSFVRTNEYKSEHLRVIIQGSSDFLDFSLPEGRQGIEHRLCDLVFHLFRSTLRESNLGF